MSETERSPLTWPSHRARTRADAQKNNKAWKKTWVQYMEALEKELSRMGVSRYVVTWNDPRQSAQVVNARVPGVALWFDRQKDGDFRWQDVLGIENSYCTVDEVKKAYNARVGAVHPDRHQNEPGFDTTPYIELTKARDQAIAWLKGTTELPKGYVIPSDQWKEPKQNLYAIIGTLRAFRTIERLGATQLYEGALAGFAGVLTEGIKGTTINV